MKRLKHLLLLFIIGGFVACSYNELPDDLSRAIKSSEVPIVLNVETRAETYNGVALDQTYFVSEADLENYVRYRRSATKQPNLTVKEVKSYGFDSSQTLFYILNYEKGWEVVSADKRVQPTLAYGDEGAFTMDCDNEPMKFWMNMLADGVLQTRQRKDDNIVATTATASSASKDASEEGNDEEQNVAFWNAISPIQQQNTRDGGHLTPTPGPMEPLDPIEPIEPIKYVYLVDEEVETMTSAYGPLVEIAWGQGVPWNKYSPLKTDGSGERAPTGCAAVAGAQVLYYLQDYYNLPLYTPVHCIYSGTIDEHFVFFDLYQTDVWDNMAEYYYEGRYEERPASKIYDYPAMLMRYAGDLIDMTYGNSSSTGNMTNLKNNFFSEFDISCNKYNGFSLSIITDNIIFGLPVILRGNDDDRDKAHIWITDGYERVYKKVIKYYVSFDTPQFPHYIDSLDKNDAHFSSTSSENISKALHMNWGWDGAYDGFYAASPNSWSIQTNNETILYDTGIYMLYGFSPK